MLQPVTMVPSAVSSAAPTLMPEKAARACRLARRAAATSLEALNDPLEQGDERSAHATSGLHHFIVVERLRQHASRHVGDARDAQHLDAHMTSRNRLRDR